MNKYLFIFLLLTLISCKKDEISSPSYDGENKFYPTTLYKLSQSEFDSLQIQLNQSLGTSYIAKLDSFGLLGHFGLLTRGKSNISDPAQAISTAKLALLLFTKYSNIHDTSIIRVRNATHEQGNPTISDWRINFQNQLYENIEVWNTEILTILADDFVFIDGHHYENIFIPHKNVFSKEQVKKNLLGTQIQYFCWTPGTFAITDSTINLETMEQCIYPLIKVNSIELHVVWKVPISPAPGNPAMWYYFIDVLTGEIIGLEQLFIC